MNAYTIGALVLASMITFLLRFAPFLLFGKRGVPKNLEFLVKTLPQAMMAILVVYCLKDIKPLVWPFAFPEMVAIGLVILLHLKFHQTYLSIFLPTLVYMVLIQLV